MKNVYPLSLSVYGVLGVLLLGSGCSPESGFLNEGSATKAGDVVIPDVGTAHIESFNAVDKEIINIETQVPAEIDMLAVIDNSGSMGVYQDELAAGFDSFKDKIFTSDRKLNVGAITTDTYRNSFFGVDNRAKLIAGIADGANPYMSFSPPRSGMPIVSTQKPSSFVGSNEEWLVKAKAAFKTNLLKGANGSFDERAFESIENFLNVNEVAGSPTALFQKGKLGFVLILADENDRSYPGTRSDSSIWTDPVETYAQSNAVRMKNKLDAFFRAKNGLGPNDDPHYYVAVIANQLGTLSGQPNESDYINACTTILADHSARCKTLATTNQWNDTISRADADCQKVFSCKNSLAFNHLVKEVKASAKSVASAAKYSKAYSINMTDYASVFSDLNTVITQTETKLIPVLKFVLKHAPRSADDVKVVMVSPTGARSSVSAWELVGQELRLNTLKGQIPEGTKVEISYISN